MQYVETEGNTIDEAIENALKVLAVERDKVTVDILTEGKKGFLGFGAQKARIRASLRKALKADEKEQPARQPSEAKSITKEEIISVGRKGKDVLAQIVSLMGFQASVEIKEGEIEAEIVLDIHVENGGLLIGRKGQTLEALQYLLTRIVNERQGQEGPQLVVDVENYRVRRQKSLEDMALRLGEKAKRSRKPVTVDALSAADRRIIHVTLQDDPWLTTKSLGQGAYRRLIIIPEGDRRKKEEEKGRASSGQMAKGPR
jgi:spoIIIJ-associated protein